MKLFEFLWVRNGKICHFGAEPALWYRYKKWVPVPFGQRLSGTGTDQVVPVPIHQKRVGTDTDQSCTGTDASSSLDFCTLALLSHKFVHQ